MSDRTIELWARVLWPDVPSHSIVTDRLLADVSIRTRLLESCGIEHNVGSDEAGGLDLPRGAERGLSARRHSP